MKYLISGGGTGGHIFPAISIARKIQELDNNATILFIGAKDRMEMQKIPQNGYDIIGLPIKGIDRNHFIKNLLVPFYLCYSLFLVYKIICKFQPDVAIGVGGYASAAAMKVAAWRHIPILLQEQNNYAGLTNKILRNDARYICVAYTEMERFFPKNKIIITGNPVRKTLLTGKKEEGQAKFFPNGTSSTKTLLILGGSLGAKTINEAIAINIDELKNANIQIIWQTGKNYYEHCKKVLSEHQISRDIIFCKDFITDMPNAYALADLVISRAGAGTIAELSLLGKPAILIPSPNVAEDHQKHHAMALVNKMAAIMINDNEAQEKLVKTTIQLIRNEQKLNQLSLNISQFAQPDADTQIAQYCIQLAKEKYV